VPDTVKITDCVARLAERGADAQGVGVGADGADGASRLVEGVEELDAELDVGLLRALGRLFLNGNSYSIHLSLIPPC
jgi:hypothetical protein